MAGLPLVPYSRKPTEEELMKVKILTLLNDPEALDAVLRTVFDGVDKDKSGRIDNKELKPVLDKVFG